MQSVDAPVVAVTLSEALLPHVDKRGQYPIL